MSKSWSNFHFGVNYPFDAPWIFLQKFTQVKRFAVHFDKVLLSVSLRKGCILDMSLFSASSST